MAAEMPDAPRGGGGDDDGDGSGKRAAAASSVAIYSATGVSRAVVERGGEATAAASSREKGGKQPQETPPSSPASAESFYGADMATEQARDERVRRSSGGSCSDDSDALGDAAAAVHQLPVAPRLSKADGEFHSLSEAAMSPIKKPDARPPVPRLDGGGFNPERALSSPRTFNEVVSPRSLANGKRFLSGYLQRRVPMAAGLLKTWRRQFFRLRDHGVVCYKDDTSGSAAPLFEICFTAHSVVQADRFRGDHTAAKTNAVPQSDVHSYVPEDQALPANGASSTTRKQSTGSLAFILKHVEIVAGQQQTKVEVPMFLRADNEHEFGDWLHCLRLKMEARKQALAAEAASIQASTSNGTPLTAGEAATATKAAANDLEDEDRVDEMKSPSSTRGGKTGTPKASLMTTIKRSLSFGKRDTLLFGAAPDDPPEFAQFHQRFMLMREIGEGSFSIVHKAVNRLTGRLCAVKCCKYSPALVEEVRIMKKLSHPNLVKIEGVFKHEDMHYVVMDFMGGGDLCDMLIRKQRLPEKEARCIIAQVLQGLDHLHANCVLHRDIKPENILLHGDVAKIADFGLAKQLSDPDETVGRSCGTLEYAAPELISGREYGLKSDVFSLGVVMYVLLFGAFPFSIESATALQDMEKFPQGVDVRDMACLSADNYQWRLISPEAQDAILRMLHPDPKDRISAAELLQHPWFDVLTVSSSPQFARSNSNLPRYPSTASLGGIRTMLDAQQSSRDQSRAPTDRQLAPDVHSLQLTPWQMRERISAAHETQRQADCEQQGVRELLCRGMEVTKFGFKGDTSPHVTTLRLDLVNRCISWTARPNVVNNLSGSSRSAATTLDGLSAQTQPANKKRSTQRSILLHEVLEIRVGHATEAFERAQLQAKTAAPATLCLSVVSSRRTLDVAVKAPSQRAFLERGLRELLVAIQPHGGGTGKPTA